LYPLACQRLLIAIVAVRRAPTKPSPTRWC